MKIAHIGAITSGSTYINQIIKDLENEEIVVVDDKKPSYINYEIIKAPPVYPDIIPKPTCSKHHEYVQQIDGDWLCRHCGREL